MLISRISILDLCHKSLEQGSPGTMLVLGTDRSIKSLHALKSHCTIFVYFHQTWGTAVKLC